MINFITKRDTAEVKRLKEEIEDLKDELSWLSSEIEEHQDFQKKVIHFFDDLFKE